MVKSQPMSKWAIIKINGKQHKVGEGETVLVDSLISKGKQSITVNDVLLVANDENIQIGKPIVTGAKVTAKILEDLKDKKIKVVKFKSKSRYLRTRGHRQKKTKLLIEKIEI